MLLLVKKAVSDYCKLPSETTDKEKGDATASLAAAKEFSVDALVVTVFRFFFFFNLKTRTLGFFSYIKEQRLALKAFHFSL